jgi:hypothetical protein
MTKKTGGMGMGRLGEGGRQRLSSLHQHVRVKVRVRVRVRV